jgi:protein-L-isoaspartate(D-aspartate) O-methyltransferase
MLAPRVEARVLQELAVKKHESVLEIGAGSGYMAALLAHRAQHVLTVDIEPELAELARNNLIANGVLNAEVATGDASRGWAGAAPYDVICVSGGLPVLPQEILEHLKIGGRLAAFVGTAPVMKAQIITRIDEKQFRIADVFGRRVRNVRRTARQRGSAAALQVLSHTDRTARVRPSSELDFH